MYFDFTIVKGQQLDYVYQCGGVESLSKKKYFKMNKAHYLRKIKEKIAFLLNKIWSTCMTNSSFCNYLQAQTLSSISILYPRTTILPRYSSYPHSFTLPRILDSTGHRLSIQTNIPLLHSLFLTLSDHI